MDENDDVVSITPDLGAPPDKGSDPGVSDVDDLVDKHEPSKNEPSEKQEKQQESPPPTDEGVKSVADQLKELQEWKTSTSANLTKLEQDKKNLQIALHRERQAKKEASSKKDDETPLTDAQLQQILDDNPGDHATMLKVVQYKAAQAAKEAKGTALNEVDENNRAKTANDFILSRYPALADETSDLRMEVEQTKERFGLTNHKMGDLFAVGIRVTEDLPNIIKSAYEKGKADAIAETANKKREAGVKDADLTPKGKGAKSSDPGFSGTLKETADQLNLSPSARKIMKSLISKTTRSVVVED